MSESVALRNQGQRGIFEGVTTYVEAGPIPKHQDVSVIHYLSLVTCYYL
jgi:hypothetical protein